MAEKKDNKSMEEEKKIPVFTVLKNGSIFKSIFLLDSPPPISELKLIESSENSNTSCQEKDEILLIGRHPDCNILLEHPSISRFHLRICSQPTLQKLSVMDLSSAHGTWVSGQKIDPQVPVELNEGETLRLGASTRIYRLHWISLSRAFDGENPFVSPADAFLHEEEDEEETYQDENSTSVVIKITPLASPASEIVSSSFPGENSKPFVKNHISSAPLMSDCTKSSFPDDEVLLAVEMLQKGENQSPSSRILGQRDISSLWSEPLATECMNSSMPEEEILSETTKQLDNEYQSLQVLFATEVLSERENRETPMRRSEKICDTPNLWSRRGKPATVLQIQTGRSRGKNVGVSNNGGTGLQNEKELKEDLTSRVLIYGLDGEEEIFTPDKENYSPNTLLLKSMKKVKSDKVKHPRLYSSSLSEITMSLVCINVGMESENEKEIKDEPISRVLFHGLNGEEEIFTPNKENFTPNTLLLKSMKKGKVHEIKHPKLYGSLSSKITASSTISPEELFSSFDKVNLIPKVLQEWKSKRTASQNQGRVERVPFQSLLAKSDSKRMSEVSVPSATTRSSNSVNRAETIQKNNNVSSSQSIGEVKRWNIVVDTTSLLNKESRRSLKLLRGLKGTLLIIPRMVIMELDCLRRRGSLFRRATEASSILQWIEECMVNTRWWIHVQSSLEAMQIAPTPPSSPPSPWLQLCEGSNGGLACGSTSSILFSSFGSLMEIVSPTAEDHILECALLFKRIKNDGQLILLTNDVALKIKAMAEGLLCETAEEFRESLVNPYSERFLWVESTPRGPTWACIDDIVLKENYYNCPVKKMSKTGCAKGLKLILRHNSHYGKINSVN